MFINDLKDKSKIYTDKIKYFKNDEKILLKEILEP